MPKLDFKQISKIREQTGSPVIRVKQVLDGLNDLPAEEAGKKALEILKKEGFAKAAKREGRSTEQGIVATYLHHTKKVAALVEVLCETDFVAKNELFIELGDSLAMQLASMGDEKFEKQDYIKDPSQKISDLVKAVSAKTGENIKIGRLQRVEIGK